MLDKEKDLYIKSIFKQDDLISKKADDLFKNFNINKTKQKKEHKINTKYTKIAAVFASVLIIFGAANVYATTQGYENIFFMIKYLATSQEDKIEDKNQILSDRDIVISFEPIRLTENIGIQIANLQIKDKEATLFLNVYEKEIEEDKNIVPLKYKVYDSSDNKLCEQNSLKNKNEKLQNYTEELKLSNFNKEDNILKLEIYKANSNLITTIKIDLNTKSIEVSGEEEALKKISEIELKEFLGNSVEYKNEDGEYIKGTCIDVTNISYCGGLYTVTFTYCFLGNDSIFEVDINDYNIYQNTFTIELNQEDKENKFNIVSKDKEIIIKSSEEKEEGKVEEDNKNEDSADTNETTIETTIANVNKAQLDNYASTMSWTEYWAPGIKFKYPTDFSLQELGGAARGSRQGATSTKITGIATGINPETKEVINSNMTIEICEPEYTDAKSAEEYCKYVYNEMYGNSNYTATFVEPNTGLSWTKVEVKSETEIKYIYTHFEDIGWGYKIIITVDNPNNYNYKVANIINWILNSTKTTNY